MKSAFLPLFLLPLAAAAAPALRCEPERVDLGELPWGTNVAARVLVRNDGDEPLHVAKVRACCGSEASISATNVPPGESAVLTVDLRARGRSGPFRRSVYLTSDDPEEPQRRVLLEGTVLPPPAPASAPARPETPPAEIPEGVDVFPSALVYVSSRPGAPRYLRVRSADPARPLDAAVPPAPDWTAEIVPAAPGEWRVALSGAPAPDLGTNAFLVLRLGPDAARIPIVLRVPEP